jgi:hypothetical protein
VNLLCNTSTLPCQAEGLASRGVRPTTRGVHLSTGRWLGVGVTSSIMPSDRSFNRGIHDCSRRICRLIDQISLFGCLFPALVVGISFVRSPPFNGGSRG